MAIELELPPSRSTAPVRVKLQRINAGLAKAHPPDGNGKVWWARLKKALGTSSSAFVNASLFQLQGAARLPDGIISELGMNSAKSASTLGDARMGERTADDRRLRHESFVGDFEPGDWEVNLP